MLLFDLRMKRFDTSWIVKFVKCFFVDKHLCAV
nr:MAG TPA: hypothetical protein [Caudoviricetes sp.]